MILEREEREKMVGRERETMISYLPYSPRPWMGPRLRGLCPDWGSKLRPFVVQDDAPVSQGLLPVTVTDERQLQLGSCVPATPPRIWRGILDC